MTLQSDGYTLAPSDEVTRMPVRPRNRCGIEIADDPYQRKGLHQALARRGFVALCFDPSHSRDRSNEQPFTRSSPLVIRHQAGITTARHRHASSYHRGVH